MATLSMVKFPRILVAVYTYSTTYIDFSTATSTQEEGVHDRTTSGR